MAPTTNSPKAIQHSRSRPSVPKAIVPAIPLPYIQKRKQQVAALEKTKENAQPAPAVDPQQSSPTTPPAVVEPAVANGSSVEHSDDKPKEVNKEINKENEPIVAPAYLNGEESINQEPATQVQESIPGKLNSLYFKIAVI